MATMRWHKLTEPPFELTWAVVSTPWLCVIDAFRGYTHLRIVAEGTWCQSGGEIGTCDPDGLPGLLLRGDLLTLPDCPVGALIGKLGGSSANVSIPSADGGNKSATHNGAAGDSATTSPGSLAEGKAFAIGSYCVVTLPQNFIGPLFVSFNGLQRPVRISTLRITVEGARAT